MRRALIVLLLSACSRAESSPPTTEKPAPIASTPTASGKDEAATLMDAAVPFAEKMLKEHGEFFPYASAIASDGTVTMVAPQLEVEQPAAAVVVQKLEGALRAGAAAHSYRATALVLSVRMTPPGSTTPTDAIAVRLDHAKGYSAEVVRPYTIVGGTISYGTTVAVEGRHAIFGR